MPKPNIVYVHSHDTGRWVQPYGYAVPTPRIQRLAEEGVLFRQAFDAAPTCSPSRAALLTGQAPHSCGQFGLVNRGFELRDREKHLAHTLRAAGYRTALSGVHHVVRDPLTCGYEAVLPREGDGDEGAAKAAARFLAEKHDRPFFLAVGFFATHRRFPEPGPEDDPRWMRPPAPLPDTPETRRDTAAFHASARRLDACVGEVLDAIEANGLADDTLVLCTTDHGPAFPLMKCNLTDHGTGVMLILRGPGGFRGGKVLDAMVSHVDVFPTLCELAEIAPPPWLQGRSLMPLVRGEAEEINDAVFAEVNYHCPYEPMRSVRTRRWKYVRRFADSKARMPANIDDGPSKTLLMEHGLAGRETEPEELYDLIADPNEACNRANDPASAEALETMRERLEAWMRRTEDPLSTGPIPAPPDATVSEPGDPSPDTLWERLKRPPGYA